VDADHGGGLHEQVVQPVAFGPGFLLGQVQFPGAAGHPFFEPHVEFPQGFLHPEQFFVGGPQFGVGGGQFGGALLQLQLEELSFLLGAFLLGNVLDHAVRRVILPPSSAKDST
jgi:hypothetical protein